MNTRSFAKGNSIIGRIQITALLVADKLYHADVGSGQTVELSSGGLCFLPFYFPQESLVINCLIQAKLLWFIKTIVCEQLHFTDSKSRQARNAFGKHVLLLVRLCRKLFIDIQSMFCGKFFYPDVVMILFKNCALF